MTASKISVSGASGFIGEALVLGLEVMIRPRLASWPKVKGNFLSMLSLLKERAPSRLRSIQNQRSPIAIGQLVSLVVTCIDDPVAAYHTFLASDDEDLFTTQPLHRLSNTLSKPARFLSLPEWLLKLPTSTLGKQTAIQRICGSLQLDVSKKRELSVWALPVNMDKVMLQTVGHYLEAQTK